MTNNRMNNQYNRRNSDYENRTDIYYDGSTTDYRRSSGSKVTKRNIRRDDDAYTVRDPYRHTEDARAVTRAKSRRQNVLIATLALTLVAAVAVGTMAISGVFNNPKTADTAPTSISAKADSNKGVSKAAQTAKQTAQQTEAKQDNAVKTTQSNTQQTPAVQTTSQTSSQNTSQTSSQTAQNDQQKSVLPASSQTQSSNSTAQKNDSSENNIEVVNGDRIYKDTKRQAPDKTGTPAHYYANGKTSYGFDWDYDTDNGNFTVKCDYNFNQQQYDFTFYGTAPGTAHVTLYYFTSDSNKVPVNLTVTVDNDLNVSVG